ncbi:MAG: BirA family transcriptional regulator [Nocardioidaceae bacterium]|nr:BirA family transcriptional regulator [Nocardioidaceae bacterium]
MRVNDRPGSRLPLDRDRIAASDLPRLRVEVVQQAASTNALVAARARAGEPDGLVVVAEHQTAGRGRLDRSWETPANAALTFSVLVRAEVLPERWPWLPLLTGVAVSAGVEAVGGPACVLKWPNDVLHDGRKLAGILAERIQTPSGSAGVVGLGLNVSQSQEELPVPTAGSLATTGHHAVDRTDLLLGILRELERRLTQWSRGDDRVAGEYLQRMDTLGRRVRVLLPGGDSVEGLAVGVSHHGALELETVQGRRTVSAGDVVHVRPA